ncbi:MAG: hypothetical protein ACYC25_11450 [Paludibacter sp.]
MTKLIEKIPGIAALILVFVSIVLVLLVYVGGNADSMNNAAGEALTVPKFTDALLYWTYSLFGLALLITVLMAVLGYVRSFIANPVSALKSLIPIVLFILIFVVAWSVSSGEKMTIIGYEGTGNEGNWARFSDMVIYSIYALFVAIGVTIIGSRIYVSLK